MSKLNNSVRVIGGLRSFPFLIDTVELEDLLYCNSFKDPSVVEVSEELSCLTYGKCVESDNTCKCSANGCDYCFIGNCEQCHSELNDDSIESGNEEYANSLSVLIDSRIIESVEEKSEFIRYINQLVSELKNMEGVEVCVDMEPVKDENGNNKVLKGCEDLFISLVKSNKSVSDLLNVLVVECSITVKVLS